MNKHDFDSAHTYNFISKTCPLRSLLDNFVVNLVYSLNLLWLVPPIVSVDTGISQFSVVVFSEKSDNFF